MNLETEWNNSVNKSNIEVHDFIFSGLDMISLRTIRSEERQLDDSCIRRQRYSGTPPYGHLVNTGHLVNMAKFFWPIGDWHVLMGFHCTMKTVICMTKKTLNVEFIQSWLLEVVLFNGIFNPCSITKGRWNVIENHEKSYWSLDDK